MSPYADIDDYLASCPEEVRGIVARIRETIRAAVPEAGERISYAMPTMTLDGRSLVHFAAWKHHIGLYPLPTADGQLQAELAPYDTGKGTARFPLDQPIPYELIGRLVSQLARQREHVEGAGADSR